ncbi:hypothetical protein EDB84DRAFT_1679296 [Lactarius hengduanensis]|nr:hypothetical protein EDB84DRAFT_1679296 [Lactarius hengduanensis]
MPPSAEFRVARKHQQGSMQPNVPIPDLAAPACGLRNSRAHPLFPFPTALHSRAALAIRYRRDRTRYGPTYDTSHHAEACALTCAASRPQNPVRLRHIPSNHLGCLAHFEHFGHRADPLSETFTHHIRCTSPSGGVTTNIFHAHVRPESLSWSWESRYVATPGHERAKSEDHSWDHFMGVYHIGTDSARRQILAIFPEHRTMSTPPSNFKTILDAALSNYKIKTGKELLDHPLATELQRRDTVDAVLAILQDQAKEFQHLMDGDQRLMVSIGPLTRVLFAFSGTLGVGDVGLAFPPAKGIIAGIGILLAAAKDVRASHDALVELFERIENPFKRLGDYTQVSLTTEMAEVSVKIMAEVLSILSITTKEVKRWRANSLIEEQIRMATTQATKATSELKDDVKTVSLAVANIDGIKCL